MCVPARGWKTWGAVTVAIALMLFTHTLAADSPVTFDISTSDIKAIEEYHDSIWIQLAPSAAARLREATEYAHGQQLVITIEGIQIMSARVNATIESGVIRADGRPAEVRARLAKSGYPLP